MISSKLYKIADLFYKKAQYIPDPMEFRKKALIAPIFGYQYSFVDLAHAIVDILHQLNPDNTDQDINTTTKSILDLVDIVKIPDADDILDVANLSFQTIKEKTQNANAIAYAKSFVNLSRQIVNYFYNSSKKIKSSEESGSGQETNNQKVISKKEGLVSFLERVFKALKSGQNPSADDINYWNANSNLLSSRLKALVGLKQKTPLQQQEITVISYIKKYLK